MTENPVNSYHLGTTWGARGGPQKDQKDPILPIPGRAMEHPWWNYRRIGPRLASLESEAYNSPCRGSPVRPVPVDVVGYVFACHQHLEVE